MNIQFRSTLHLLESKKNQIHYVQSFGLNSKYSFNSMSDVSGKGGGGELLFSGSEYIHLIFIVI